MSDASDPARLRDELLVLRCQLGEREAFDELIRVWALPLRRHVLHVTGDATVADDLVQEIWLAVVQGIGRLREPAQLRPWLFGIAHRRLQDRLRSQYRASIDPHQDLDRLVDERPQHDRELLAHEVERGLARLPAAEREVLDLFHLQELSLTEIAAALAVPLGTVKSRLFRARRLLRDALLTSEIAP